MSPCDPDSNPTHRLLRPLHRIVPEVDGGSFSPCEKAFSFLNVPTLYRRLSIELPLAVPLRWQSRVKVPHCPFFTGSLGSVRSSA